MSWSGGLIQVTNARSDGGGSQPDGDAVFTISPPKTNAGGPKAPAQVRSLGKRSPAAEAADVGLELVAPAEHELASGVLVVEIVVAGRIDPALVELVGKVDRLEG